MLLFCITQRVPEAAPFAGGSLVLATHEDEKYRSAEDSAHQLRKSYHYRRA
jgi:hypothetical protein